MEGNEDSQTGSLGSLLGAFPTPPEGQLSHDRNDLQPKAHTTGKTSHRRYTSVTPRSLIRGVSSLMGSKQPKHETGRMPHLQTSLSILPLLDAIRLVKKDPDLLKVGEGGWETHRHNTESMVAIILLRMSNIFFDLFTRAMPRCMACVDKARSKFDPAAGQAEIHLLKRYVEVLSHFDAKTGRPPRSLAKYVGEKEKEYLKQRVDNDERTLSDDFKDRFCFLVDSAVHELGTLDTSERTTICPMHQFVLLQFVHHLILGLDWKMNLKTLRKEVLSPSTRHNLSNERDGYRIAFDSFLLHLPKDVFTE